MTRYKSIANHMIQKLEKDPPILLVIVKEESINFHMHNEDDPIYMTYPKLDNTVDINSNDICHIEKTVSEYVNLCGSHRLNIMLYKEKFSENIERIFVQLVKILRQLWSRTILMNDFIMGQYLPENSNIMKHAVSIVKRRSL